MTTLLNWFRPLERCTTLDQITENWPRLLWELDVVSSFEDLRYHDAVLSFLARSGLPANLKFGAVFGCASPLDFDLRLALGLLDAALDPYAVGSSVQCPMIDADCVSIPCANPWVLGYVHGRLTQVRTTMGSSTTEREGWTTRFWNEFLVMSCRWADADGVHLALDHGAQPHNDNFSAIAAAAEGTNAWLGEAYYTEGRSNADYRAILDLLLARGVGLADAAAPALQAAAATGNLEMLDYLVLRGANIRAGDDCALIAAAGNHQLDAIDWLLENGANVHAQDEATLLAAIGALSLAGTETLLDAGADLHAVEAQALQLAFSAMPYDLYAGDCHDFIHGRADMVALLLARGAGMRQLADDASVCNVPHFTELIDQLLKSDEVPVEAKPAIRETFLAH